MCGRFIQKLTWRQIHDLYSLRGTELPLNLQPHYNGAPVQDFAACRLDEDGNRTIAQLRWGLVPAWFKNSGMSTRHINPGQRPFTPSLPSATHSAHDGAWCRPTGGSSGNGPATASNPTSWPLRTDRRCRSPRCGSAGARTEYPWSPSPSSRRQPPRRWPTSTIGNRRSSTPTGSTTGSIPDCRCHGSSSWCVNPVLFPSRGAPSARG